MMLGCADQAAIGLKSGSFYKHVCKSDRLSGEQSAASSLTGGRADVSSFCVPAARAHSCAHVTRRGCAKTGMWIHGITPYSFIPKVCTHRTMIVFSGAAARTLNRRSLDVQSITLTITPQGTVNYKLTASILPTS